MEGFFLSKVVSYFFYISKAAKLRFRATITNVWKEAYWSVTFAQLFLSFLVYAEERNAIEICSYNPWLFSSPINNWLHRQLKFMKRVNGKICAHSRCLKLGSPGKIVRKLDKAKSHIFRICPPQTKQWPFSSSKNPYFQNGAKCETSLEKMAFICMKIRKKIQRLRTHLCFKMELGNGLLNFIVSCFFS